MKVPSDSYQQPRPPEFVVVREFARERGADVYRRVQDGIAPKGKEQRWHYDKYASFENLEDAYQLVRKLSEEEQAA
jgi:hypothetical protein